MSDGNPEIKAGADPDFVVRAEEGGLDFHELMSALLDSMVPVDGGGVQVRLRVEDSSELSAEAAANEIIHEAQALGLEAYPEPQHPKYTDT